MSIYQELEDSYQFQRDMRRFKALYANWSCLRLDLEVLKNSGQGKTDCIANLKQVQAELNERKVRIDAKLETLETALYEFLKRVCADKSTDSLESDVELLKVDLNQIPIYDYESAGEALCEQGHEMGYGLPPRDVRLRRLSHGNEGYGYVDTILHQKEVFEEIIEELEHQVESRKGDDPVTRENGELRRENQALNETLQNLAQTVSRLEEDFTRAGNQAGRTDQGSRYERAAEKYLAGAEEKEKVLKRIMGQWNERREGAPEDQRRTVDKIYRGILDKFSEEL